MGRSVLAIFAGYLTMLVVVTGSIGFLFLIAFDAFPTEPGPYQGPSYVLWLELAFSGVAAVAGGYVCAHVARGRPLRHAAILIAVALVLGVVSAVLEAGLKPLWSSVAIPAVAPLGIWLGAWLRARSHAVPTSEGPAGSDATSQGGRPQQ